MATGKNIRTYYEGTWHDGDVAVMRAADHGTWLGTTVFDGARYFEGKPYPFKSGASIYCGSEGCQRRIVPVMFVHDKPVEE